MLDIKILIPHKKDSEYEVKGDIFEHFILNDRECVIERAINYSHQSQLPDYIGVMQADLGMIFSNKGKSKKNVEAYMTDNAAEYYGLNTSCIKAQLRDAEGVVAEPIDVKNKKYYMREWNHDFHDYYWHYIKVKAASLEIYQIRDAIHDTHPDFLPYFDAHLRGFVAYSALDFVLKKELFCNYLQIVEDVLSKLDPYGESTRPSINNMYWSDEVARIILGAYIYKAKSEELIIKNCKTFAVKNTSVYQAPTPKYSKEGITIVTASSDGNSAHVGVWLQSCIEHFSDNNLYDIIVLESEMTDRNKERLLSVVSSCTNVSLRFFNPTPLLRNAVFNNAEKKLYGQEIYYRLFTPWALNSYDKIIMIDTDIIVKADLAELYKTDMNGKSIACTFEIGYLGILNRWQWRYEYTKYAVGIDKPYHYNNAGVMLLDLKRIRKKISFQDMVNRCKHQHYLISDQDLINNLFQDDYLFLGPEWNFHALMKNQDEDWSRLYNNCPLEELEQYERVGENVKILHYVGIPKPWEDPSVCYGEDFWNVARKTCYYEDLILEMISAQKRIEKEKRKKKKEERKVFNKELSLVQYHDKNIVDDMYGRVSVNVSDISKYKNIHQGKRCFFIGTGPSLRKQDLEKLKGECTFAFNNVFPVFENTEWRPTYYISDSQDIHRKIDTYKFTIESLSEWDIQEAFVPVGTDVKDECGVNVNYLPIVNIQEYYALDTLKNKQIPIYFNKDCKKAIYSAYIPMYAGMQIAAYMGFSEIYLIGCDARYEEPFAHCYDLKNNPENMTLIGEKKSKYKTWDINRGFLLMNYAARLLNMRVYNSTRGGYLTIFPRISLDTIKFGDDKKK